MTGYVYHEKVNQQIDLVHNLIESFKNDKEFAQFFKDISLVSVTKTTLNDYTVTQFHVKCN